MKKEKPAIGLDVGGTNLKCGILTPGGRLLACRKRKTEVQKGRDGVLANICSLIRETLAEKKLTLKSVAGIGLGTPGYVVEGVIHGAPNMPGWHGTPIIDIMEREFGVPFFASNDVTLAALAEYRYGQKAAVNNMVLYAIGTGIGGGLIINGSVYEGSFGMAGELGHQIVENNGRRCGCGIRGCVEAYSSTVGLIALARERLPGSSSLILQMASGDLDKVTPKIIYDAAKRGDKPALEINDIACRYLATAIGGMINILSPDLVVLGGGVMQAGEIILNKVREYLPSFALPDLLARCRLDFAKLGEDAGVVGCGAFVFEKTGKLGKRGES